MLNEGARLIKPKDIQTQVPWEKLEGVVILELHGKGKHNILRMSSVSIEELTFLSKQLDSHINSIMGSMIEG